MKKIRNHNVICDYFKNQHKSVSYLSILDVVGGALLERIYAYRYRQSDKKPKVKEIIRINLDSGEMKISSDLYHSTMAGYRTVFEAVSWGWGYYNVCPENKMVKLREMIGISFERHFKQYEFILMINKKYKDYLLSFNRGFEKTITSLYHYHLKLQKHPATEYFLKLGLLHLVSDSRVLKKAQDDLDFRKYIVDNRTIIKDKYLNYNHITRGFKSKINLVETDIISRIAKVIDITNSNLTKKILEYLKNKDVGIYVDTVEMQIKQGVILDYFPKDLLGYHDQLHLKALEKESLEEAENYKLKAAFKKTKIDDLQFIPLKTVDEYKKEGEAMKHCVYSAGYYKRDNSLIMSVRNTEDDERIETIEIDLKNMKLEQSRGLRNQPTVHHERIIAAVNEKLLPRIRQMKLAQGGA